MCIRDSLYQGKIIQFDTPYQIFHNPSHKIIAKSISNSNILEGISDGGKIKTDLGEFVIEEKINSDRKVNINVRPSQLSLVSSEEEYEIVEEEFLEGNQLFLVKNIKTDQIINVSMSGANNFFLGQKVGIQIINNYANMTNIS